MPKSAASRKFLATRRLANGGKFPEKPKLPPFLAKKDEIKYQDKKKDISSIGRSLNIRFFASATIAGQCFKVNAQYPPDYVYDYFNSHDNSSHYALYSQPGIPHWFFTICNVTMAKASKIGSQIKEICLGNYYNGRLYSASNTSKHLTPTTACILEQSKKICKKEAEQGEMVLEHILRILVCCILAGIVAKIYRDRRARPIQNLGVDAHPHEFVQLGAI